MSTEKLKELDKIVSEFQQRLAQFEVSPRELTILSILGDLLTNVDIASRDIYWAKKDWVEDNVFEIAEKRR